MTTILKELAAVTVLAAELFFGGFTGCRSFKCVSLPARRRPASLRSANFMYGLRDFAKTGCARDCHRSAIRRGTPAGSFRIVIVATNFEHGFHESLTGFLATGARAVRALTG